MPNGEWAHTDKGHASKVFYKFKYRWQKKGYEVDITTKQFYPVYLKALRCGVCGGGFGTGADERSHVKSIKVDVEEDCKVITIKDITIVHLSCNMLGNTNAGSHKEPEPY